MSSVWPKLEHNYPSRAQNLNSTTTGQRPWRHPPRVNPCSKYRFETWVRYINFVFGRHLKYNCISENFKTCSSKCPTSIAKLYTGDVNVLYDLCLILLGPLGSHTTQRFGTDLPGKGSRSTSNTSGIFIYTYVSISPFRDTVEMSISSGSRSLIAAIAITVRIAAIQVVWRQRRTPTMTTIWYAERLNAILNATSTIRPTFRYPSRSRHSCIDWVICQQPKTLRFSVPTQSKAQTASSHAFLFSVPIPFCD